MTISKAGQAGKKEGGILGKLTKYNKRIHIEIHSVAPTVAPVRKKLTYYTWNT